jgi:hypothetical protein
MDHVGKAHRDGRHLHMVFEDGLRTSFPACQGTLPTKMVRLLEQLDDDDTEALEEQQRQPSARPTE